MKCIIVHYSAVQQSAVYGRIYNKYGIAIYNHIGKGQKETVECTCSDWSWLHSDVWELLVEKGTTGTFGPSQMP